MRGQKGLFKEDKKKEYSQIRFLPLLVLMLPYYVVFQKRNRGKKDGI